MGNRWSASSREAERTVVVMFTNTGIRTLKVMASGTLLLALLGCTTLSSGSKYTLAKVGRDRRLLVEPKLVDRSPSAQGTENESDRYIPNTFGIKLNGGYLRYLDAVEHPEVAIFAQVKMMGKSGTSDETMVWEKVFLSSEDRSQYVTMNKDCYLPLHDIPLLPPFAYNGEEIVVIIRVIELDRSDNKAAIQLIQTAAAAGAQFRPDVAAEISVFQSVLSFFIKNNQDDIEYQWDFAISKDGAPVAYRDDDGNEKKCDMVFQPVFAQYAVIKTEHPGRICYPDRWIDMPQTSIRYVLAQTFKWGTLDIVDWPVWHQKKEEQDVRDFYLSLFGDPFTVSKRSTVPPRFDENGYLYARDTGVLGSEERVLQVRGDELAIVPAKSDETSSPVLTYDGSDLYRDQSYLLFSIYPTSRTGRNMSDLKGIEISKKVADLRIDTVGMTDSEFAQELASVTKSVTGWATKERIRAQYRSKIDTAETSSEVAAITDEYYKKLAALNDYLTTQTLTAVASADKSENDPELDSDARDRIRSLGGSVSLLDPGFSLLSSSILEADTTNTVTIGNTSKTSTATASVAVYIKKKTDTNYSQSSVSIAPTTTDLGTVWKIVLPSSGKDEYPISVKIVDSSDPSRLKEFVFQAKK
jgi:hypothetical protein